MYQYQVPIIAKLLKNEENGKYFGFKKWRRFENSHLNCVKKLIYTVVKDFNMLKNREKTDPRPSVTGF